MKKTKKVTFGPLQRTAMFDEASIDVEARTVELSFSSELPVREYFGMEILDHSPGAVRLERMNTGGPVYVDHSRRDLVGVVERCNIGPDRRGHALVRFGKSARAEEVFNDVKDKIRTGVSFDAERHKTILEKSEDGVDWYRTTDWEPVGISLESCPADITVGVGREKKETEITIEIPEKGERTKMDKCLKCGADMVGGACPACAAKQADIERARAEETKIERARVTEITSLARKHGLAEDAEKFISEGKPVQEFKDLVITKLTAEPFRVSGGENLAARQPYRSLGEQLMDVMRADKADGGIAREKLINVQRAISGMSTSVPSDGGYLVQTAFTTALLDKPEEVSNVWARCFKIPIGAGFDSLEAPFIDETSRATGSRWGGVQVYRAGEAGTVTAQKPKIGIYEIRLYDIKGICYATNRLLQNATTLEAWIQKAFRSEMFFKLDDEVIRGTGAGQCMGITVGPSTVSVAAETAQVADTVMTENVNKMYNAMLPGSRKSAVWLYNLDLEPQLELLQVAIGTGGVLVPMFVPAGVGNNNMPYAKLKGLPAYAIEQASAPGDVGDIMLCDLENGYITIDQGGIDAQSSIHVKFLEDETAFRFTYRANGAPRLKSVVAPYKGATSRSHLIMLAAR